jgi:mercuric ion binding protein
MNTSTKIVTVVATAITLGVVAPLALARVQAPPPPTAPAETPTRVAEFSVGGMKGPQCPAVAERTLSNLPGVVSVEARFEDRSATVIFDPTETDPDAIAQRLAADSSLTAELTGVHDAS